MNPELAGIDDTLTPGFWSYCRVCRFPYRREILLAIFDYLTIQGRLNVFNGRRKVGGICKRCLPDAVTFWSHYRLSPQWGASSPLYKPKAPIAESRVYPFLKEYQVPSYWDKRSPLIQGRTLARFIRLYNRVADLKLKKRLGRIQGLKLDAGCGSGRLLSCSQVGVDFSEGMLRRAKGKGELVRASVTDLPFRDQIFDFAYSVDVALHLDETGRQSLKRELRRVSRSYEVIWPTRFRNWWRRSR